MKTMRTIAGIIILGLVLPLPSLASRGRGGPERSLQVSCSSDACVVSDVSQEYPFIVSLDFLIDDMAGLCTGSLVSEDGWVLTAAHCCVDEETLEVDPNLEVAISFAPDTKQDEDAQRVTISADSVFPNPSYDGGDNDICLLSFDPSEVDWEDLYTVDLVQAGTDPSYFDYQTVQVMGYGTTGNADEDEDAIDSYFRTITLETVPCSENNQQTDIICTQDLDVGDVCQGDSGGPLLWPTIIDGQPAFLQIGIVSKGPQCADRINDPEASEQPRGEGMEGTWNFLPYQSDFICETANLCDDYDVADGEEEEEEETSGEGEE